MATTKRIPNINKKILKNECPSSSSSSSIKRGDKSGGFAKYIRSFVGCKYVSGGASPSGFDCSGFTMSVYQAFGISIPRTSWSQQRVGSEVSLENARAGDIVCYAGHVAIYLGNGQIVHASTERTGIKYGNMSNDTQAEKERLLEKWDH